MVSTKLYYDYNEMEVFASAWADDGRIEIERLKQLEISFLNAIQWNILVREDEFYEKLKTVEKLLAMKEGLSRGWFTYTEMELLMPSLIIARGIFNNFTILMFSYACSICAIALSSIILASIPPTTDLSTLNNVTTTTVIHQPNQIVTIDETILEVPVLNFDGHYNFTINFPLFDRVTSWSKRNKLPDFVSFPLSPRKLDPAPFRW